MTERLQLGAPGLYELPDVPLRALTGERMDVCAFVGVAPRGPAREPLFQASWAPPSRAPGRTQLRSVAVAVESWGAYLRLFGGFEGPGRLPYAVASFFENGGRRAYVVRIVHDYGVGDPRNAQGVARGRLAGAALTGGGEVSLRARDEGSWGNALRATLSFVVRPLRFDAAGASPTALTFARDAEVPPGALLRLTLPDGTRQLCFVSDASEQWHPETGERVLRVTLATPAGAIPEALEVVEGALEVRDGRTGQREHLERLGLCAQHPRWLAAALVQESTLLYPDDEAFPWLEGELALTAALPPLSTRPFAGGEDRFEDLVHADFFDPHWVPGDEYPGSGVQVLAELPDVSLLVVPDLYSPEPLVPVETVVQPVSLVGAEFAPCLDLPAPPLQAEPAPGLEGLRLNPELPEELSTLIGLQQELVTFAEQQALVVLLDVPPRLDSRRILNWRARFTSSFAAAYHPWLMVARPDDLREPLVRVNPSAVAAGIIAQREFRDGVQHGPANVLAQGVVDVVDRVSPARHDVLHPAGINVFLRERDGVRLTAARTLALDPAWRQLSVRRLMTLLRRTLERQMQWVVFEPNHGRLRTQVRHLLGAFLRQLFLANAFQGEREEEAFFVRCGEELNSSRVRDAGRFVAEVGVAPAEPLEFLVLQIVREGDGTLRVES